MRIKRKAEFGDIGTVVYYSFPNYFIPDPEYKIDPKLLKNKTKAQIDQMNTFLSKGRISTSPSFKEVIQSDLEFGSFRAVKRLIQGSNKHFDGIDFAEYDFNAVLEDQKFNNRDLISYLDLETASKIGTRLGSLEKINSTLFPTLSNSDAQANDIEYFGTLSLSAITLYLFNLDPGIHKVELYEDIISENNSVYGDFIESDVLDIFSIEHVSPVITIYLGPNQECQNNAPSKYGGSVMYNQHDPLMNNRNNYYEYDPLEYSKLCDEINAGKSLWLALSSDKSIKEVNLSYNAWLNSEDANIFKHKFNMRNDDYYDKTRNSYLKIENSDYSDRRSGKLLGNKILVANKDNPEKSLCPILSRKLRDLNENMYPGKSHINDNYLHLPVGYVDSNGYLSLEMEVDSEGFARFSSADRSGIQSYCPEVEYEPGTIVYHKGEVYKALRKGNRGHFPDISSYWALNSRLNDYYTTRVTILNRPQTAGTSDPNKQITIVNRDDVDDMNFSVTANLGYKFSAVQRELMDGTIEDLICKGMIKDWVSGTMYKIGDLTKYNSVYYKCYADVYDSTTIPYSRYTPDTIYGQKFWKPTTLEDDYLVSDIVDGNDYYNVVTILENGWKKLLETNSRSRLVFYFEPTKITSTMQYSLDDNGEITTNQIRIKGYSSAPESSSALPYEIVLASLTKNGQKYDSTNNILAQLNSVTVGDELEFEFVLVDYIHTVGSTRFEAATLTKKASGETTATNSELNIESVTWEFVSGKPKEMSVLHVPVTVDYDDLTIDIAAATKLNMTVSEYSGFEVSKVNDKVNYGGTESIQFYGTYRDAFKYLTLYDKTLDRVTGDKPLEIIVEGETVLVSLSKSGAMYTLVVSNVVKDLDIKLIEK